MVRTLPSWKPVLLSGSDLDADGQLGAIVSAEVGDAACAVRCCARKAPRGAFPLLRVPAVLRGGVEAPTFAFQVNRCERCADLAFCRFPMSDSALICFDETSAVTAHMLLDLREPPRRQASWLAPWHKSALARRGRQSPARPGRPTQRRQARRRELSRTCRSRAAVTRRGR